MQAETADIKELISKPDTSNSEEFTLLQDSVRKLQIYQISIDKAIRGLRAHLLFQLLTVACEHLLFVQYKSLFFSTFGFHFFARFQHISKSNNLR